MAIGDTVQAGLMRIDPSAIERAGQANAKANQAFGLALGEVAKGYFIGQEKKARANEIKEELMRSGLPEEAAANISKNPFLQKEHARKQEAESRMNIARLAQRSAGDALAQKAAFEGTRIKEKNEAKQSATNIAKFNLDRPDLPITEETPAAFLPELDPDPFVGPPTTYQGQAPAVAQLPESFQPQGAQVVDAVQSGRLSPLEGNRIMDSIQGQAMTPLQVQEYNINAAKELREQTDFKERYQNPSENLSVGQETIDREFAKDLVDFNPADINKGLTQLREASARLGGTAKGEDGKAIEPENLTGAMIGLMPDAFNDIFNPQASEVKEAVEEVVQRNLRLVLGAAFSQKEGERLINRAYNIRLSEKENKKRVDRLIKSIDGAMQQKQDQARYFNEKGTLKGYQFAPVSIESIERDAFDGSTTQPSANTIDPTDLENAIQAKRKQLEQRTMMQQTLDNPNVPNYGSQ